VKIETGAFGDFVVTVRDPPEGQTSGVALDEALALAADAIKVAVSARIDHDEGLAVPSAVAPDESAIPLAAKADVYRLW
jgi:predicted RNase H-like HicB family nuclease